MSKRPEKQLPPELHYNETEAKKYTSCSRIQFIQERLAERALELLCLKRDDGPKVILDIGCGSGLSGKVLEEAGHIWVGTDISASMLGVAGEGGTEGDLLLHDMGQGLPFRHGVFDGAISISALQWLFYSHKKCNVPRTRLIMFFRSLYDSLKRGSRCALQFYPENAQQQELVMSCAQSCGFTGGILTDFPHSTKAKKHFLCLFAGRADHSTRQPTPLGVGASDSVSNANRQSKRRRFGKGKRKRAGFKSKDWVLAKKERQRKQGRKVRPDSKYTARKRRGKF